MLSREFSIFTGNNHPSNPQQPIQQPYVKGTSKPRWDSLDPASVGHGAESPTGGRGSRAIDQCVADGFGGRVGALDIVVVSRNF